MLALHRYKQWYHGLLGHEVPIANFKSLSSFQGSNQAPLNAPSVSVLGDCSCSGQQ
uniref:Macaca fascicularis brain cDNA clone: QflA-16216, similar to human phosphoinositide-3-kinase, regulatory subunit 4, p150(PIK3R4), mRNA, RefSeq: NM_014602.1 n=1 Tax=Macaca fascicularis TaxID=9541 RepID=I7GBA3_MACFA|nr:unnamed protein product [Macaca fascicularis]